MIDYTINKASLWDGIDEEVSRAADEAYGEDGSSLYDSVVLTERDRDTVNRFIDDAVNLLVRRAFDVTKYATDTVSLLPKLVFYVPDFDESTAGALAKEIDRYIVLYAATSVFQGRRASLVPEYTPRTQAAMDKVIALLKSRKHPVTLW
jgi:hypothetical protein